MNPITASTTYVKPRSAKFLILLAGIAIAICWVVFAVWVINLRANNREQVGEQLMGQRDIVAEHANDVYRMAETFLGAVTHWIMAHPERDPRADSGLDELVARFQHLTDQRMLIRLVAQDGDMHIVPRITRSQKVNVSDRDYFIAAVKDDPGKITFSGPFQGRATGKWATALATRLDRPSHGIALVFVAIEKSMFDDTFAKVRLEEGESVSLVRRDGILLARSATNPGELGKNLSASVVFTNGLSQQKSGVIYTDGKLTDSIPKLIAYTMLDRYPIAITVGKAIAGVERIGQEVIFLAGAAVALLSLLIAAVARQFIMLANQSASEQAAASAIAEREHHLRTVIDLVPHFIFAKDKDGIFTLANRAIANAYGTTPDGLVGKSDGDFNPDAEQVAKFLAADQEVIRSGQPKIIPEELITDASGQLRYLQTIKIPYHAKHTDSIHVLGVATDITSLKQAETKLRIAATAFDTQVSMVVTDTKAVILEVNKAFTQSTGYSAEEVIGRNPSMLWSDRHDQEFYQATWSSLLSNGTWQGEIWARHKDGKDYPRWSIISAVKDGAGIVTHYVSTHFDLSERKKAEERINALAFYDQLTSLPNRALLLDRLERAMTTSSRSDQFGALLLIDLDNFKTLNDTQGHEIGDKFLKQVATCIQKCVREEDTLARLGGDEFVVLIDGFDSNQKKAATTVELIAEKILHELDQPYRIDSLLHNITASIGVTLFKGSTTSTDEVMKQADLAMYKAKESGKNRVRFFDQTLESAIQARTGMESDLRHAIEVQQFFLHYQPQVEGSSRIIGAEALVRWRHPQRGIVSPADFITLAEETDLILPLGDWVMRTACQQLVHWAVRPELAELSVAVNVSAKQFLRDDFTDRVRTILRETGANPKRLKLELTESLLARDVERIIATMYELKAQGVGFSLDDFGTGYSSLSYLKRLPLDQLKIDQSFVRDVLSDANDVAIVRTVVALGQTLGLSVIAEGVETEAQREFLGTIGCQNYQGYLFSRPVPVEEFEQKLCAK